MQNRKNFKLTVEGETEMWYFQWLRAQINAYENRTYDAIIDPKVQQSPRKYYKRTNNITTDIVFHICDIESTSQEYAQKMQNIMIEMQEAQDMKNITYVNVNINLHKKWKIIMYKIPDYFSG